MTQIPKGHSGLVPIFTPTYACWIEYKYPIKLKFLIFILFITCRLYGQSDMGQMKPLISLKPIQLTKLQNLIEFDGRISAAEWDFVDTLSMVSHWPNFSVIPNKRTQMRLAYDDRYIYFSAYCFENTDDIQVTTFERDIWNLTNDQIALFLDTYNDNENALVFVVTPTASRVDASVKNDAQSQEPAELSWNSFWEARTKILNDGWSMEARIPFSSLRFQPGPNGVVMGLIAYRYAAKNKQMDIYPAIPPEWGFWSFAKPSQANDVSFIAEKQNRPWFTSPYLLASTGFHHETSKNSIFPNKINDQKLAAGLDVQHAITDNMNLDVTLNTDFAQAEVDDQVVNLSRFSLFFPEKRRFFLERSSIMDFQFEDNNRLFYSRRIGIGENSKIAPLWGGARLVGRVKDFDLGIMNMQSRRSDGNESENFSVLRLRKKVSRTNSYIGGIFTSRTNFEGNNQFAYGVDGIFNIFKNDYFQVNLASTWGSTDTFARKHFPGDNKRIYALWEKRTQVGFNYGLVYSQVDKNYVPGMGFEARNNFKAIGNRISYGWLFHERAPFRYMKFDLSSTVYFSKSTNKLESYLIAPSFYFEGKKFSNLTLTYNRFYDNVLIPFELSRDITIPANNYVNQFCTLKYQTAAVSVMNAIFLVNVGSFYSGRRFSAGIQPSYAISKYLTLSGFYEYNRISFDQLQDYEVHVARLKLSTSLNVKLSMNAFVQLSSLAKISAYNFRLRYNSKDGDDIYLVYNGILNYHQKVDPSIPNSESQSLVFKLIHTFLVNGK